MFNQSKFAEDLAKAFPDSPAEQEMAKTKDINLLDNFLQVHAIGIINAEDLVAADNNNELEQIVERAKLLVERQRIYKVWKNEYSQPKPPS